MAKETTDTLGLRLPWAGKIVAPENVDEELTRLWHMSADNVRTSQNLRVRMSVLNLVLCASDVQTAQRASALLRDLSSTHIARVTLLILDHTPDAPTSVSTWVTLRSFPVISDLMRHSFEQITARLTGAAIAGASTILQPLLKPDLPIYLWWVDDLSKETSVFNHLASLSTRIVVDSQRFSQPETELRAVAQVMQESGEHALSDLTWGRITSWRELVAQFFDVAEYRPYLGGVDYIEIEHAVRPSGAQSGNEQGGVSPNPTSALLLGAWLKTRLGWSHIREHAENVYAPDSGTYSWHMMRSDNGPSRVSGNLKKTMRHHNSGELTSVTKQRGDADGSLYITPRELAEVPPGSICSIRLISNLAGSHATFTIDREDDAGHVSTSVELSEGTRPQRTVSIASSHKESELLHDELEIMGHDHLYEETLLEVSRLITQ